MEDRRRRSRRLFFLAAFLQAVIPAAACRDVTSGGPARSMAPQRALASTVPVDDDWDTFAADVTVTLTGGLPNTPRAMPSRRLAYHTEHTLGPDSTWGSSMTFTQLPSAPERSDYLIARLRFVVCQA